MNPFTRKDTLAGAAASTLDNIRNMSLKDYLLNETRSSPQVFNGGAFYIERPESVERINAFIKRFLAGTHINAESQIRHLFMHLQSVGLVVDGYIGKDGTFDIYQYGKPLNDKPIEDPETDKIYFPRGNQKGKLKISRTLVPGGRYMVDAEMYMAKA
jgi:hypothetical protein